MTGTAERSLSQTERLLPWLVAAIFMLLLALDCGLWHPGYAYLDEGNQVSMVQDWREGRAIPFELFKGSVYRACAVACVKVLGPSLLALRMPGLVALGLECLLLFRMGCSFFGRRAGLWAVLACLACAQTFLRARSLLSFTVLPFEMLALLMILPREWSGWASFLYGAALGALLSDYEGGLLCLPIVALFWMLSPPRSRPSVTHALAGFGLVLGCLVWNSWDGMADYLSRRMRSLPGVGMPSTFPLTQFLNSFFMGGDCIAYLGVSQRSFVAAWTLPALAIGLTLALRRATKLLLWLALGCLPCVTIAAAAEPNRILAAWPALCILCGAGLAWLLLVGGGIWEAKGYSDSMKVGYERWYSESTAVARLQQRNPGKQLVNELGGEYSSQFRFLWPQGEPGAKTMFLLPWEFAPGLGDKRSQLKFEFTALGEPPLAYLDTIDSATASRLCRIDSQVRDLRRNLPRFAYRKHRELLLEYLRLAEGDVWTRTIAFEEALRWSSDIGNLPEPLLAMGLRAPLVSSSGPLWLANQAHQSGDDPFARRLCARALQIDFRRPCIY